MHGTLPTMILCGGIRVGGPQVVEQSESVRWHWQICSGDKTHQWTSQDYVSLSLLSWQNLERSLRWCHSVLSSYSSTHRHSSSIASGGAGKKVSHETYRQTGTQRRLLQMESPVSRFSGFHSTLMRTHKWFWLPNSPCFNKHNPYLTAHLKFQLLLWVLV